MSSDHRLAPWKAAEGVVSRLFDHRPFTQGEIGFMVKQFEQAQNDQEIINLFSTLELVTDIKEEHIDNALKICENEFDRVESAVNNLDTLFSNILSLEMIHHAQRKDELKEKQIQRNDELSHFISQLQKEVEEVDLSYKDKEEDMKKFYEDLEKKLKIS